MRVGIIQSNYIPWRGYFDFIHDCDLFILHDDVQYTKGDWRNRNRIRTGDTKSDWLTVPVQASPTDTLICNKLIDYSRDWRADHLRQITQHYRRAPFLGVVTGLLEFAYGIHDRLLSTLNWRLTEEVCGYLGITTPIIWSMSYACEGSKTDKVLALCQAAGADEYLSGPAAKAYLDIDKMESAGVGVEWKDYSGYPDYPQQYAGFDPHVSVLDLIANVGPEARNYIWGWRNA